MRACLALALSLVLVACGGGGGGGVVDAPTPLPPPDNPGPPPIDSGLSNFKAASFVLGQAGFGSGHRNRGQDEPSADSFRSPNALALTPEGGLLVADTNNSRILHFPSGPGAPGPAANGVVGQVDLHSAVSDVSQTTLDTPRGLAVGAGKMVVADAGNHRVLIYTQIPGAGFGLTPSAVIGQGGFSSNDPDCGAGLDRPAAVAITPQGQLVVADSRNHRVLVWNSIPETQEAVTPANLVLGQFDADHCAPNDDDQDGFEDLDSLGDSAPTARTLKRPMDVWSDGQRLVVADQYNSRVLIWTNLPEATHFQRADIVLGHLESTNGLPNSERREDGSLPNPTDKTLKSPLGVHSDGTSLAVADGNQRVLIWNTFPSANLQGANIVLGQPDFSHGTDLEGEIPDPTSRTMIPSRVLLTANALFVSDTGYNRVLVFPR